MNSDDIINALSVPFPVECISWRVGATNKKSVEDDSKLQGIALAYIDARDVMDRLDSVMGAKWQCEYPWSDNHRVACRVGLMLDGEWVWRSDGAGETEYEGDKGAMSDAFKRAAVRWGVGRYLYSLPNQWVPIKPRGNSFVIPNPPKLPAWATTKTSAAQVVWERRESIEAIKTHLAEGRLSAAYEAFQELDDDEKSALWVAPTKGGVFTTQERAIMKSDEWAAIRREQAA